MRMKCQHQENGNHLKFNLDTLNLTLRWIYLFYLIISHLNKIPVFLMPHVHAVAQDVPDPPLIPAISPPNSFMVVDLPVCCKNNTADLAHTTTFFENEPRSFGLSKNISWRRHSDPNNFYPRIIHAYFLQTGVRDSLTASWQMYQEGGASPGADVSFSWPVAQPHMR